MEDRLNPLQKQRCGGVVRLGHGAGFCLFVVILAHPAIADRNLVAVLAGVAAVLATVWLTPHQWPPGPGRLPVLGCWLAAAWLGALFSSAAVHGAWRLPALLPPVLSICLLWVGTHVGRSRRAAGTVLLFLLAAAVGAALHAVLQHAGLDPLPRVDEFPRRVVGPFLNPNHLGSLAAVALPVALSGFLALCSRDGAFPGRTGSAVGVAILVIYSSLLLAGSRGAIWAAIIGGGVVTCGAIRALQRQSRRPSWLPLVLLAASLAGVTQLLQERPIMEGPQGEVSVGQRLRALSNMTGEASRSDLTVLHRRILWRAAWNMFARNPVLGVGPGGYPSAGEQMLVEMAEDPRVELLSRLQRLDMPRFAHNEWLHSLAESGLAGTIPWSLLAGLLLAVALASEWTGSDAIHRGALGACCAVLTHGLVSYPMYLPASAGCFWLLLGILVSGRFARSSNLS